MVGVPDGGVSGFRVLFLRRRGAWGVGNCVGGGGWGFGVVIGGGFGAGDVEVPIPHDPHSPLETSTEA